MNLELVQSLYGPPPIDEPVYGPPAPDPDPAVIPEPEYGAPDPDGYSGGGNGGGGGSDGGASGTDISGSNPVFDTIDNFFSTVTDIYTNPQDHILIIVVLCTIVLAVVGLVVFLIAKLHKRSK